MSVITINWTASALVSALIAAVSCLLTAFFAREGALFVAATAAGIGIAASGAYAALALRQAERRLAKLSGELTFLSERLVRLESRGPLLDSASAVQADVDGLAQATGALADALDGQDARIRSLEERLAATAAAPPPAAPLPLAEAPMPAPVPVPAMAAPSPVPVPPRLTTRDDFARAASAILGRLAKPAPSQPPAPELAQPLRAAPPPVSDEAIVQELDAGRLELWIQPVVTLPQRRARLYLALPHLRRADGEPLGPEIIRPILARHRRLARLDAFALNLGLTVAGHLASRGSETSVCLPLSRDALGTLGFVESTASRLADDATAAGQLVLAIEHADAETLSSGEVGTLERFRSLGVGLAVTGVPNLDRDWGALSRRGFDYATLAIETVLGPRAHTTTAFLIAEAARAGIALAATGIEEERQVPDLLDFDVPLACGTALAPARPVRAEALAPKAEPPPTPPTGGDGPASFRDFLRRVG
jgi:cyclic-di-GMP phosphodiesterase TipF (flagellum assembly factor)